MRPLDRLGNRTSFDFTKITEISFSRKAGTRIGQFFSKICVQCIMEIEEDISENLGRHFKCGGEEHANEEFSTIGRNLLEQESEKMHNSNLTT